jgi:hypothetical protein
MTHYLKERYQKEIAPALETAIGTANVMQIPRISVVVNIGVGEALDNAKPRSRSSRFGHHHRSEAHHHQAEKHREVQTARVARSVPSHPGGERM